MGFGALHGALAVFCRIGRPDLVARSDGQLKSWRTAAHGAYGGYIGWYDRAVNEARTALGDEHYKLVASEGAEVPLDTFVEKMIAHIDDFLGEAGADQPR
jgi:hypothetical protein